MGCNQEHRLEIVAREQGILNWLLSNPFLGALVVWDLCPLQNFKPTSQQQRLQDARCLLFLTNSYECRCWERIQVPCVSCKVVGDKAPEPPSSIRTLKTLGSLDFCICSRHPVKSHPPLHKKPQTLK